MKFQGTLIRHLHVRRKDKDGADISSIRLVLETAYLPETGHHLVDLTCEGALIVELKPVQRSLDLPPQRGGQG